MITTTAVDELRDELRDTLARSEAWLRRTVAMPDTAAESLRDVERDAEAIGKLRTRAASTLINVALLGAFSSGKSFLLSGIQGGLELVQVQSGDGSSADKFVGLLPSAPVPANACPASVVPVGEETDFDASGSGYLRVRFVGSGEWEDVGNSPVPSMIAAYVMQDADVADRLRAHRDREVAEIQISISDHRIPAKLYDLPGYG
uniref:hypothetical protein n=1 Tax=Frankia sp. CiP3 TaxID=2880971 RepID=UPI001EF45BA8